MGGQLCGSDCSTCISTESYVPILYCFHVKVDLFYGNLEHLQRRIRILSTLHSLNTGTHGLHRVMLTH
jgi:hypothetical protein